MPLRLGDTVTSFMRPDERYTVVDTNPAGKMVRCRASSGDEFWCSRTVLTKVGESSDSPSGKLGG